MNRRSLFKGLALLLGGAVVAAAQAPKASAHGALPPLPSPTTIRGLEGLEGRAVVAWQDADYARLHLAADRQRVFLGNDVGAVLRQGDWWQQ